MTDTAPEHGMYSPAGDKAVENAIENLLRDYGTAAVTAEGRALENAVVAVQEAVDTFGKGRTFPEHGFLSSEISRPYGEILGMGEVYDTEVRESIHSTIEERAPGHPEAPRVFFVVLDRG